MKKIPTLFKKTFIDDVYVGVSNQFNDEIDGLDSYIANDWKNVVATVKYDGSSCYVVNGWIYRRYDRKPKYTKDGKEKSKKKLPMGSIFCDNSVPPHEIYWVPCDKNNPQDKFYFEAFENYKNIREDWTYEIVGAKFQSNPYGLKKNVLIPHGITKVPNLSITHYDVVKWLIHHNEEGLVFWKTDDNGKLIKPIAKIRRKDFGLEWPVKEDSNESYTILSEL